MKFCIELQTLNSDPTSSNNSQNGKVVNSNTSINNPTNTPLSFASLSKIGFLKLLKLNFTSIATILLQLVHCGKIQGRLHLFVFADHICYSWWQWLIMMLFLPMLAMFPLSFGIVTSVISVTIFIV